MHIFIKLVIMRFEPKNFVCSYTMLRIVSLVNVEYVWEAFINTFDQSALSIHFEGDAILKEIIIYLVSYFDSYFRKHD